MSPASAGPATITSAFTWASNCVPISAAMPPVTDFSSVDATTMRAPSWRRHVSEDVAATLELGTERAPGVVGAEHYDPVVVVAAATGLRVASVDRGRDETVAGVSEGDVLLALADAEIRTRCLHQ